MNPGDKVTVNGQPATITASLAGGRFMVEFDAGGFQSLNESQITPSTPKQVAVTTAPQVAVTTPPTDETRVAPAADGTETGDGEADGPSNFGVVVVTDEESTRSLARSALAARIGPGQPLQLPRDWRVVMNALSVINGAVTLGRFDLQQAILGNREAAINLVVDRVISEANANIAFEDEDAEERNQRDLDEAAQQTQREWGRIYDQTFLLPLQNIVLGLVASTPEEQDAANMMFQSLNSPLTRNDLFGKFVDYVEETEQLLGPEEGAPWVQAVSPAQFFDTRIEDLSLIHI